MQCKKTTLDYTFSPAGAFKRVYSMDEGHSLTFIMNENCSGNLYFNLYANAIFKKCGEFEFIQREDATHKIRHESEEDFETLHIHLINKNGLPITQESFSCLMQEFEKIVINLAPAKQKLLRDSGQTQRNPAAQRDFIHKRNKFIASGCAMSPDIISLVSHRDSFQARAVYSEAVSKNICPAPNYMPAPAKNIPGNDATFSTNSPASGADNLAVASGAALLLAVSGIFCCCLRNKKSGEKTGAVKNKMKKTL